MSKRKDLSDFGKGQLMMTRRLGPLQNCSGHYLKVIQGRNGAEPAIEHLWDVPDKQVRSMEDPPQTLQDLKDLWLTSWCRYHSHRYHRYSRGVVDSVPRQVGAVLAAEAGTNTIFCMWS